MYRVDIVLGPVVYWRCYKPNTQNQGGLFNSIMKIECCQEVLQDLRKSGKERPWELHKLSNSYIGMAYKDIDLKKAKRLFDCASWLAFHRKEDGSMTLHNANFCRVRLCPMCAWRRSLKTYGQIRSVVEKMGNDYSYIFLTLTVKNCDGKDLSATITKLFKSFDLMSKYKDVTPVIKGYFRALEVTHNLQEDTYHPHFHVMIAVNPSYFTGRTYLSYERWRALWKKALKVSYDPHIDVQRINGKMEKAVAEVAKYATKASEIIAFDDWDLTVDTVRTLDAALENRRLTGWGGIMREVHRDLHLDDSEDGDLIHVDPDAVSEDALQSIVYAWHSGYMQYRLRPND